MTNLARFNLAWDNADLLRAYIAERHVRTLTFGGSPEAWRRARACVARLAALTGKTREAITAEIIAAI